MNPPASLPSAALTSLAHTAPHVTPAAINTNATQVTEPSARAVFAVNAAHGANMRAGEAGSLSAGTASALTRAGLPHTTSVAGEDGRSGVTNTSPFVRPHMHTNQASNTTTTTNTIDSSIFNNKNMTTNGTSDNDNNNESRSTGSVVHTHDSISNGSAVQADTAAPLYEHITIPHHRSAAHWQPVTSPLFSPNKDRHAPGADKSGSGGQSSGAVFTSSSVAPSSSLSSATTQSTLTGVLGTHRTVEQRESEAEEDRAEMARKLRRRENRFAAGTTMMRAAESAHEPMSQLVSQLHSSHNNSNNHYNSAVQTPFAAVRDVQEVNPRNALPSHTPDITRTPASSLSMLSRTWWSFMRKMTGSLSSRDAEVWREAEAAWFGAVGETGLYPTLEQNTAEMTMLWRRLSTLQTRHGGDVDAQTLLPSSSSSGTVTAATGTNHVSTRWNGELWLVIFALATQIHFMVSSVDKAPATNDESCSSSHMASLSDHNHHHHHGDYNESTLHEVRAAMRAHPSDALSDACTLANHLSSLIVDVYQPDGDGVTAAPYALLPLLLRRVRLTFEVAGRYEGVLARVQSNAKATMSRLFALLYKRVKAIPMTAIKRASTTFGSPSRDERREGNSDYRGRGPNEAQEEEEEEEVFMCLSASQRQLLLAFAVLLAELIVAEAPMTAEMDRFIRVFSRTFPHARAERCTLYYCKATVMTQQSLTFELVRAACDLFTRAMIVCPERGNDDISSSSSSPEQHVDVYASSVMPSHALPVRDDSNRRILFVKLMCCQLALGRIPQDVSELHRYGAAPLLPVVEAVQKADLAIFTHAMHTHAAYYVETGVHNILHMVRQRIILLMVVKYYIAHGCESRLSVLNLVNYYRLPYTEVEAMHIWLLPLLVKKYINGVLHNQSLVLSQQKPFDDYDKGDLLAMAAAAHI